MVKLNLKNKKNLSALIAIFILVVAGVGAYFVFISRAATNVTNSVPAAPTVYISPTSQNLALNETFTVTIKENSGTTSVNAVQANFSYPTNLLEYIPGPGVATTANPQLISFDGGAFGTEAEAAVDTNTGNVRIARAAIGGVTGEQKIATLTFRVKASSGTAALMFKSGTALAKSSDSTQLLPGPNAYGNASYVIGVTNTPAPQPTTPPTTPPTNQPTQNTTTGSNNTQQNKTTDNNNKPIENKTSTSTSSPAQTTAQPTNPTQSPTAANTDKSKPNINFVQPSGIIGEVINLKVTTNEPVTAVVKFGTTENNLSNSITIKSSSNSFLVPLGEISKSFKKDSVFYYQLVLTDSSGNKTESSVKQVKVSPEKVTLIIKNENGVPMPNTTVLVNNKSYQTDTKGIITIDSAIAGIMTVAVKDKDKTLFSGEATIVEGAKDQKFTISPKGMVAGAEASKNNVSKPISISIISLLVLAILGFIGVKYYQQKKSNAFYKNTTSSTGPEIIVGDVNSVSAPVSNASLQQSTQPIMPASPTVSGATTADENTIKPTPTENNSISEDEANAARNIIENK
jgi:flagellar basal body-associated protein FliL